VRDLTTVDVTEIEVVVAAHPAELCGDDLPAVGRDRGDEAVPAELEGPLDAGFEVARDDVEVDSVAAIRREGQRAAGGVRRVVLVPLVDDERLCSGVELRALVAAIVAFDEDPAVGKEPTADAFVVGGHLPHAGQNEELARPWDRRGDEQLLAVRRVRERRRLPRLEQRAEIYAATPASSGMMSSPYVRSVYS